MQSTTLQIFIKVLNITFFPGTLHSLRFMIHAKTKPTVTMVSVELRFRELLSICGLPTTSILPDFMCKKSTSGKSKVIGALFFAWKVSNPSTAWFMLYSLHFLFLSQFKPTNVLDGGAFSQDILSFEFVAYQSLQRCQNSCANKQQFEKLQIVIQSLFLTKI